jgi:hypothetical protein
MAGGFPKGWWPLFCVLLILHVCGHSPPAAYRGLRAPFGHPLPWGGVPCSASCCFFMHAVAARQLHRASASFLLPSPSVYNLYPLCPLSQAQLDGSCLPFLKWSGPISCSYPRGFESHRGPLFLSGLLAFLFSPSPIGYTESFFFALRNLSRLDIAPPKESTPFKAGHIRYKYSRCGQQSPHFLEVSPFETISHHHRAPMTDVAWPAHRNLKFSCPPTL